MKRHYTLEYWIEDDWFVGRLREVPGVFSQGETLSELEENILDAFHLMMEEVEPAPSDNAQSKELVLDI